jgi:hypothetical protein
MTKRCAAHHFQQTVTPPLYGPISTTARFRIESMANLTLVYGMRLLPAEEIVEIGDAAVKLKNGREARVTMHLLEGSKDEIEKQLKTSLEAFFDFYPEI